MSKINCRGFIVSEWSPILAALGFAIAWGWGGAQKSEDSARRDPKITERLKGELQRAERDIERAKQDWDQALAMDEKGKTGLGAEQVAERPENKPAWLAATQH